MIKAFSMFSGIGGFDLALKRNNIEIIGHSEIDKFAETIYLKHFTNTNYGDATKINTNTLPDFDLLVGGFPCQSFSVAGKRRGFDDTRGTLFFEVSRILRDKRPRYFLLENVKGLLSHESGKTFQKILKILTEMGYRVEWQVLNSKNFGVPQNRERIFIIGYFGKECGRKILPFGYSNKQSFVETIEQGGASTLTGKSASGYNRRGNYIMQLNNPIHSNNRIYSDKGISPTLNTMQGGNRQPKIAIPVLTPTRTKKRQNGRRFKNNGEPAFTLTGQDQHGIYDGVKIRRLTPVECERLQGFPDNWTQGISDTQRYKCLGNAVTVNVVNHILFNFSTLWNHQKP